MADVFNAEEVAVFKHTFDLYDSRKYGTILFEDLLLLLRVLNFEPTGSELRCLRCQREPDEDEEIIYFEEFLQLVARIEKQNRRKQELADAFRLADKDKDNLITKEELHLVLVYSGRNVSDDLVKKMMHQADLDRDGKINVEEFIDVMLKTKF